MKAKVVGSVVGGLAALGLIVASARAPWFEWTSPEAGVEIGRTGVTGAPSFVMGAPVGSVELAAGDRRTVDLAVCVYSALLVVGVALWACSLAPPLSRRIGPGKAILALGGAGAVLLIAVAIVVGLAVYAVERLLAGSLVRSTWLVPVELERARLEGPLLLLVGWVLEALTLIWSLRRQRA